MKSAFIPEDQSDLNPAHLNEASQMIDGEHLSVPSSKKREVKLKLLKNQTLSKNKTAIMVILILGNVAVILLLIFIYFSL